ncbi:MAG: hypothetical protein AB7L71_00135 [Vicinamibacterales bacterium]
MDRRTVLKLGAGGIAGTLVRSEGVFAAVPFAAPTGCVGLYTECEEGRAFARELQARGGLAVRAAGDLARLWYLDLRAPEGAVSVAGLTDRGTLFCLEELARAAGMCVRYRVDHLGARAGGIQHDPVGPSVVLAAVRRLPARRGFGAEMAAVASRFEPSEPPPVAALKRSGPFSPAGGTALVSWFIA